MADRLFRFFINGIEQGANGSTTDEKVKVSINDVVGGYLNGKLISGNSTILVENNDGGAETLTVDVKTIDTVATAELLSGTNTNYIVVKETGTLYQYSLTSGALRDGLYYLDTADAGATRWEGIQGQYNINGVNTKGNVIIEGDLTVNGTTTTINTDTLLVEDKNIEMGVVAVPDDTTANGGGMTLKGATDKTIIWDNVNGNWTSSEHLNLPTGKVYKINNVDINTAGTLTNVAYQNQANTFTENQAFGNADGDYAIDVSADGNDSTKSTISTILYSDSASVIDCGYVNVGRTRGTKASPDFLNSGDSVGIYGFSTWNGTSTAIREAMLGTATENHSAGNLGTELSFWTTDNGSGTVTKKATLTNDGNFNLESGVFQVGGADINTSGTLNNVAYLDQANTFTQTQIIPSIKPNSDSTTAIQITKADGTTDIVTIDSTNERIGIGTDSPSVKLEILADANNKNIRLTENTGSEYMELGISASGSLNIYDDSGQIPFIITDGCSSNTLVLNNSKVGIGNPSPELLLHLDSQDTGDSKNTQLLLTRTTGGMSLGASGTAQGIIGFGSYRDGSSSFIPYSTAASMIIGNSEDILFYGNTGLTSGVAFAPTELMRIDGGTGNVGIGTNNPQNPLSVNGIIQSQTDFSVNGTVGFMIRDGDGTTNKSGIIQYTSAHPSEADDLAIKNYTATGEIGLFTNSLERVTIDAAGKVGIGTSSPSSLLEISGVNSTGELRLSRSNTVGVGSEMGTIKYYAPNASGTNMVWSGTTTSVQNATAGSEQSTLNFYTRKSGVYSASMSISGERLGIGTTTPAQILHTRTNGASNNTYLTTAGANNVGLWFANNYDTTPNYAGMLFDSTSDLLKIFNSQTATNQLVIDNTGNVGIGTGTAISKVDISNGGLGLTIGADSLADTRTDSTNKNARIGFAHYTNAEEPFSALVGISNSTDNILYVGGGSSIQNAATSIRFYTYATNAQTTGTERMRVTSDGNLELANSLTWTSKTATISQPTSGRIVISNDGNAHAGDVFNIGNGSGTTSAGLEFSPNGTGQYIQLTARRDDYSTPVELKFSGSSFTFLTGQITNLASYNHDMNGETIRDLQINNSGELGYDSSTIRKKTNIENMEDTSWIYNLRPVNFEYKAKDENDKYTEVGTGIKEYGLIAEEVEQINSSFVFYNETDDGLEVEGVHYKKFIPVLLKEIQSLKSNIGDNVIITLDESLDTIMSDEENNLDLHTQVEMLTQIIREQQKTIEAMKQTFEEAGYTVIKKPTLWDKILNIFK